jgi:hypothetical protein
MTWRTSARSMPMPKALVATMTGVDAVDEALLDAGAVFGDGSPCVVVFGLQFANTTRTNSATSSASRRVPV